MINIETKFEGPRGCGYRKRGGIYLVADGMLSECPQMPIEMSVCPCCSQGIKPARGFTWISPNPLIKTPCDLQCCRPWEDCPPSGKFIGRCGLLWIGEKFYATPDDFLREANTMGVSRRIPMVPRGFEAGKTWIMLGHRKGIQSGPDEFKPALIFMFRPEKVEYVLKETETEQDIERLVERGLTPVIVRKEGEQDQTVMEPTLALSVS